MSNATIRTFELAEVDDATMKTDFVSSSHGICVMA